jgi:hypothetical protein
MSRRKRQHRWFWGLLGVAGVGAIAMSGARLSSQEVTADSAAQPAVRANLPTTRLLSAAEAKGKIAERLAAMRQRQAEAREAQAYALSLAEAPGPNYRLPQPPPDAPVPPRPDAPNGEITRERQEVAQ